VVTVKAYIDESVREAAPGIYGDIRPVTGAHGLAWHLPHPGSTTADDEGTAGSTAVVAEGTDDGDQR
jgi:hypothetical protein